MSPYGTEHFKNATRAHKHFLLNMGLTTIRAHQQFSLF
jgi:hypothetical protein